MKRLLLLSAIAISLFFTVQSFNEQPTSEGIAADTLCFSRDILPIFNSNCAMAGCHDPSTRRSGYNMTTYSGVKAGIVANNANNSPSYRQMMGGMMPQGPYLPVPDSFKSRILTWINQGAKNTTCTVTSCDTSNVTFLKDIKPIIQLNCVGCHQTSLAGGGIDLSNDADNENQKVTIYSAAAHMSSSNMPKNIAQLNSCDLAKLRIWALGIPNSVNNDGSASDDFKVVQTNQGEDFLRFVLNASSDVSINVYSADGRNVLTLPSSSYAAGLNEVRLGYEGLNHGLYFVRFLANGSLRTLKYIR